MRTHLLRTFYPPSDAEPDAAAAANEEVYESPAIAIAKQIAATPAANTSDDDYQLGGYAGI